MPQCELHFSEQESTVIDAEISQLVSQGVIMRVIYCKNQFISNIFIRPKNNGKYRLILNLAKLNENINYRHFKMESLNTAMHLISKNCYFASVDLCDAYYIVPVASEHRKYLRFTWKQQMYEFTCLPNGLACAPRLFTKLMKPVFATLRSASFISVAYIDDSLLISDTAEHCSKNVNETINLLSKLGFNINYEKSVLILAHYWHKDTGTKIYYGQQGG